MQNFMLFSLGLLALVTPFLTSAQELVTELPVASAIKNSAELHAQVTFDNLEIKQETDGSFAVEYAVRSAQGAPIGSSLGISLYTIEEESKNLIKIHEELLVQNLYFTDTSNSQSGSVIFNPPLDLKGEFVARVALYGAAGNLITFHSIGRIPPLDPLQVPLVERSLCKIVTENGTTQDFSFYLGETAPTESFDINCPIVNSSTEAITISPALILRSRSLAGTQLYSTSSEEVTLASGEAYNLKMTIPALARGGVVAGEILLQQAGPLVRLPFSYRITAETQHIVAISQTPTNDSLFVSWQNSTQNPLTLTAEFVSREHEVCTSAAYSSLSDIPNAAYVAVPKSGTCSNAVGVFTLLNSEGVVVDTVQIPLSAPNQNMDYTGVPEDNNHNSVQLLALISILSLVSAGLLVWLNKQKSRIIVPILIFGGMFFTGVNAVEAGSANGVMFLVPTGVTVDNDTAIAYSISTNKSSYAPGETIFIEFAIHRYDFAPYTCAGGTAGSSGSVCGQGGGSSASQYFTTTATAAMAPGNHAIPFGLGAGGYNGVGGSLSYSVTALVSCSFSGYLSWGSGCGVSLGNTSRPVGGTITVSNTNANYNGSVTYRCDAGPAGWSLQSSTCDFIPPPTLQCSFSGYLPWGSGCGATLGPTAVNQGQSMTISNTNANYNGSVTYRCDVAPNGWTPVSTVCSYVPPPPPPAPTGLSASTNPLCGSGTNYISWNSSPGATSYNLYDGSVMIFNVNSPYTHAGRIPGATYSYIVQAVGPGGGSGWSAPAVVTTSPACAVPPAPPSGAITVSPAPACGGGVTVTWGAGANATSYEVSRNGGASWTNVGNVLTVTEPGVPSTSYTYMVRSRNASGASASVSGTGMSSAACPALPPAQPSAPTVTTAPACGGQLRVSWTGVAGATGYDIQYREVGSTGAWSEITNAAPNPYTITSGLTPDTSYDVQVRAKNALGATSPWSGYGTAAASAACTGALNIDSFDVPPYVLSATTYNITWSATGATKCSLDAYYSDLDLPLVGQQLSFYPVQNLSPSGTWTGSSGLSVSGVQYTLICYDGTTVPCVNPIDGTPGICANSVSRFATASVSNPALEIQQCSINEEANSCTTNVTWSLLAGSNPFNVWNETTGATIGSTNQGSAATNLVHGLNILKASAQGISVVQSDVNVTCTFGLDLFYNTNVSLCKKKPIISVVNVGNIWIRSGQQAEIKFRVNATYPVTCSATGGVAIPSPAFSHVGTIANPLSQHSFMTESLNSTQIVKISCEETSGTLPDSRKTYDVRVNVLPNTQEI